MNIEKTISDLTECYRLIGAAQAKKGLGIFTQEDSRFLSAMYEAGLRHEKTLSEEIAKRDAQIAELEADQDKANAAVAIGNYLGKTYNYFWCDTSLASQTIDLLKEQAAEITRLKSELQDSHKRNYITHSLFETGDTDCPEQAKDRNGEVVLGVCKNCGRIEVDLAEPCDHRKEIARLKSVIAKCHSALTQCKQWKEGANTLTCHNHEAVEEALAAIKEIDHATD